MKILMDFRKYDGAMAGVEVVVYNICKYMGEHGHEIILLCKFNKIDEVKRFFSHIPNIKFVSAPVKTHMMGWKNFFLDNFFIQDLAFKEKVDVIHFPYNWSFPIRKKAPCVLTIHDLVPFTFRDGMPFFVNKLLYRPGIRKACRLNNIITTISKFSKKDISEKAGIDEKKIIVIPNGFQEFKRGFHREHLENLKKMIGREYIMFVGGLKERKNVPRLIEAFAMLVKKTKYSGNLVITNDNSSSKYIKKKFEQYKKVAERNDIEDRIIFTGFLQEGELGYLMRRANFTIYSSLYEGFGLPILESMYVKVPVITSDVTSMPEVAEKGALLVDPYDVTDMYNKMERILEDTKLRNRLTEKGRELVKKYSWKTTGEMYLEVYKKAVGDWCGKGLCETKNTPKKSSNKKIKKD